MSAIIQYFKEIELDGFLVHALKQRVSTFEYISSIKKTENGACFVFKLYPKGVFPAEPLPLEFSIEVHNEAVVDLFKPQIKKHLEDNFKEYIPFLEEFVSKKGDVKKVCASMNSHPQETREVISCGVRQLLRYAGLSA